MKPDRKIAQTTVKMTPELQLDISAAAAALGISSMEFIRRACVEKISRDAGVADPRTREIVRQVLKEEGMI